MFILKLLKLKNIFVQSSVIFQHVVCVYCTLFRSIFVQSGIFEHSESVHYLEVYMYTVVYYLNMVKSTLLHSGIFEHSESVHFPENDY